MKTREQPDRARALYVHVPFCLKRCAYCDFYSHVLDPDQADRYLAALAVELDRRVEHIRRPAGSVFLGGGTPTSLGPDRLDKLLELLAPFAGPETEFSVEANPGTIDDDLVTVLAQGGVNRVNVGAQSFRDEHLAVLGRIHTAGQIGRAVERLRAAGIDNIGLDLIYAVPGQSLASWEDSLRQAIALGPAHVSCYALSYPEGTALAADLSAGRVAEMDEDRQRTCYDRAVELLTADGLEHYEISNFARPGRRCRHNLTYWHNRTYVGVGPGAASYLAGVRETNLPDLDAWLRALLGGRRPPREGERLTGRARLAETLMLGLRLIEGVDRRAFRRRFDADPVEAFEDAFRRYERLGAVAISETRVRLAREALFVSDTVLAELISKA